MWSYATSIRCFCAISFGILALLLLCGREKLILPIVGNQFGCFLLVKPIALTLVYGIHRLGILYAIAASMHEIPSFLSILATLRSLDATLHLR